MTAPQPHPCQACNLCCDGTLFRESKITPGEYPALAERFELYPLDDTFAFAIPCRYSTSQGCACYAERPKYCRTFRCAALIAFQDGGLDRTDLEQRIADAVTARDRVLALAGPGLSLAEIRAAQADPGKAAAEPELHLALGVLEMLLKRHFCTPEMLAQQVSPRSGSGRPVP